MYPFIIFADNFIRNHYRYETKNLILLISFFYI